MQRHLTIAELGRSEVPSKMLGTRIFVHTVCCASILRLLQAQQLLEREQAQTWPEPEPKPEPEPEPGPEHEPELEPGPGPGPDHDASAAEEFRRILQATVGSDTTTKSIPFDVAKFEVIDNPPKKMCKLKYDSHP